MTNLTRPSGLQGRTPGGFPAQIRANDDEETTRGKVRENESAIALARLGYNVEQNPSVSGDKNPDYEIEGRVFDCYAPSTANSYNIVETIRNKVEKGQTSRIVLNLDDSNVSFTGLREQLLSNSISGLLEIIVIKSDSVIDFFPITNT